MLAPAQNTFGLQDDPLLRMLEAEPLQRVGKLDIHAEIVGIELELIAFEQRRVLVDVHQQRRNVAVDRKLPVTIARRIGGEIDPTGAVGQFAFRVGHATQPFNQGATTFCNFAKLCCAVAPAVSSVASARA